MRRTTKIDTADLGLWNVPAPIVERAILSLTIPVVPLCKERPRYGSGRAFTAPRTAEYEHVVSQHLRVAYRAALPLSGPLELRLAFHLPDRRRKDVDNLAKAILDAGNGLVWADDDQIETCTIYKLRPSANPRVQLLLAHHLAPGATCLLLA
jgi:crossover junction endodeoxyribonuclease RusA